MGKEKGSGRLGTWPPDLGAIIREINRREMRTWLEPKSGDLLLDVAYLQRRISSESKPKIKGVYARAAVVMAAATIEAVTNDALATIYELMADSIPSECIDQPPWCYFSELSTEDIATLLKKGSFSEKLDYVLKHIGYQPEEDLITSIDRVMRFRNRIVHMSFQRQPGKYKAILNIREISPLAKQAHDTAQRYVDFLSFAFGELDLPIPTIRPQWYFDDDLAGE